MGRGICDVRCVPDLMKHLGLDMQQTVFFACPIFG